MTELRTIQYFLRSIIDPIFEIFEVLENPNHPEYNDLLLDLNEIDPEELSKYVKEKDVDSFLGNTLNLDLERRTYFLVNRIHNDIAQKRLEALIRDDERPEPYNSDNLKNLSINEYKLVNLSSFEFNHTDITFNNLVYRLCPSTDIDNSNYWLFQEIVKLAVGQQKLFHIRLDPFIEIPIEEYHTMTYRMRVYGKPLDWERIRNLSTDDFGQFINEKEYGDYSNTDYIWHVDKNEIHFTCEELPKMNKCKYRGSRYFHAIFDKLTGNIIHCDGAIRVYKEDELNNRMSTHVKNVEARKVGKRIKIFQTNDNLTHQEFTSLLLSFYVWNEDIRTYFN